MIKVKWNSRKGFGRNRFSCLLHHIHYLSIPLHTNNRDDIFRPLFVNSPVASFSCLVYFPACAGGRSSSGSRRAWGTLARGSRTMARIQISFHFRRQKNGVNVNNVPKKLAIVDTQNMFFFHLFLEIIQIMFYYRNIP